MWKNTSEQRPWGHTTFSVHGHKRPHSQFWEDANKCAIMASVFKKKSSYGIKISASFVSRPGFADVHTAVQGVHSICCLFLCCVGVCVFFCLFVCFSQKESQTDVWISDTKEAHASRLYTSLLSQSFSLSGRILDLQLTRASEWNLWPIFVTVMSGRSLTSCSTHGWSLVLYQNKNFSLLLSFQEDFWHLY